MKIQAVLDARTYLASALAVVTFSQFLAQLFGQAIPSTVAGFFRDAGGAVVLASVFAFALLWLLRARPHSRPKSYAVVAFDVFGREARMDGIRTAFSTHDVAWSFMKQYKEAYPMHNFALVTDGGSSAKRTIFRYI